MTLNDVDLAVHTVSDTLSMLEAKTGVCYPMLFKFEGHGLRDVPLGE